MKLATIQLLLNKKNELTIDLVLAEELVALDEQVSLTSKNLAKIINAEVYEALVEKNLNSWLATIVGLASCATGLAKELAPKPLLKNL